MALSRHSRVVEQERAASEFNMGSKLSVLKLIFTVAAVSITQMKNILGDLQDS